MSLFQTVKEIIRRRCIRQLYGKCGATSNVPIKDVQIDGGNYIFVGEYCSFGPGGVFHANENGRIIIEDGCIIAPRVTILTRTHRYDGCGLKAIPFDNVYYTGDVTICEAVWIGQNAIILPAVRIGRGAVIAAGCVVSKSVPDYAVVAGNPARIVGWRDRSVFDNLCKKKEYNKKVSLGSKSNIKMNTKALMSYEYDNLSCNSYKNT